MRLLLMIPVLLGTLLIESLVCQIPLVASPPAVENPGSLPTPTPIRLPEEASDDSPATPAASDTYIVLPGDTLWSIAESFGLSVDTLIEINQLVQPELIQPGDRLIISADSTREEAAATPAAIADEALVPPIAATSTPTPAARSTMTAEAPSILERLKLLAVASADTDGERDGSASVSAQPVLTQSLRLCPDTVSAYPLDLPSDPIRMAILDKDVYFIADGDLYRLRLGAPPQSGVDIENLMPPERRIGRYHIQELVYLTVEPDSGNLYLLDKTNDVYRYSETGDWAMAFPAMQIPDQFPDPQFIAIQASGATVYALDADLSYVWLLDSSQSPPKEYWRNSRLQNARDMLLREGANGELEFFFLLDNGSVARLAQGRYSILYAPPTDSTRRPWPAQLGSAAGDLVAVSAEDRSAAVIDPASGELRGTATFALSGMRRVRTAVFDGASLYAAAGNTLYLADLEQSSTCPDADFDNALYFQGADITSQLDGFTVPFVGAVLPDRLRSYPGARRLYRHGVHEGVDLYGTDAPGVGMGSPVLAIADGAIVRADIGYEEMSPAVYEAAIDRTDREHRTPPDLTDAFLGRQVHVQHDDGVVSRYSHLSAVAEGVVEGEGISAGMPVGRVGVSGTSAGAYGTKDGVHLHYEIWIDGRYLGQGLSLYETMRLWQAIFND